MQGLRSLVMGSIIIAAMLLVPVGVSVGASGPRYAEVFDVGEVSANSQVRHVFTVANNSDSAMRIERAYASCDCVQILAYPENIPPRKKGSLEVRLIPAETGALACDVTLETDPSSGGDLLFKLKGTIAGAIPANRTNWVQPSMVNESLTRKLRRRHTALLISSDAVLQKMKGKQEIALVDVRDEKDYAKFRIPGSINVPLYAVRTKGFLRSRPLVLVNQGFNVGQLAAACRELRELGFSAWALDGGLNAWRDVGGVLEGALAQQELDRISPDDLFAQISQDRCVLVDISKSQRTKELSPSVNIIHIDRPEEFERIASAFERHRQENKRVLQRPFVIADEDGSHYETMAPVVRHAGIRNVFYLRGGLTGYEAFLERQKVLSQSHHQGKEITKKCASCPQK